MSVLTSLTLLSRSSQNFRQIFFYENVLPHTMPTAFRIAWDSAVIGKILKYDEDPECSYCSEPIPDGKQYGCEQCGQDVCESCMEEQGGYDTPGYRGEIDSPHPIEKHPEFNGGAYCVQCVSDMMIDGSLDSDGNPIAEEEDEGEFEPFPSPQNPLADMSDEELVLRIGEFQQGIGRGTDPLDPLYEQLVDEAARRSFRGNTEQRTNITAQLEGALNRGLQGMGQPPKIIKPPKDEELEYGFPRGFSDEWKSDDAFTSAWDVVKRERI